jgi:DNA (cytosine-5)-methyltransferase 1
MLGGDMGFLRSRTRPEYESLGRPVRLVDLFAGCGGITLGVAEAARACGRGLDVRLAVELVDEVRSVYDRNFHSHVTNDRADVLSRFNGGLGSGLSESEEATVAAVGEVELLVGGPPCQGHSDLNNYTRRNDPKNELYLVMVRAAQVFEPTHIIIENVQGVRRDHSSVLLRAMSALAEMNYEVDHGLVHLVDIGVPQTRVRHILVASRVGKPSIKAAVEKCAITKPRSLRWAIEDLLGNESKTPMDTAGKLSRDNLARAKYLLKKGKYDLPNGRRPPCHKNKPDHRYAAMYGRLRWDAPAPTITTGFGSPGQGRYLHPECVRTLTPHEAARVQFFPDWFDFGSDSSRTTIAHCIGNAVPSKLAFVLALERLLAGTEVPAMVG